MIKAKGYKYITAKKWNSQVFCPKAILANGWSPNLSLQSENVLHTYSHIEKKKKVASKIYTNKTDLFIEKI